MADIVVDATLLVNLEGERLVAEWLDWDPEVPWPMILPENVPHILTRLSTASETLHEAGWKIQDTMVMKLTWRHRPREYTPTGLIIFLYKEEKDEAYADRFTAQLTITLLTPNKEE